MVDMGEEHRHLSNFSSMPEWHTTADRSMAKALVSHETVFCNGLLRYIRCKHLGAGVYKVYTSTT